MLALSIRQPWCHLVAAGIKPIENRVWTTATRGLIALHAAKELDQDGAPWIEGRFPDLVLPESFPRGGVVGVAVLTDCVTSSDDPWFTGPNGLVFTRPVAIPIVECRGMLGLFELPHPVSAEVLHRVNAARAVLS